MFAYCGNNPIIYIDSSGEVSDVAIGPWYQAKDIDGNLAGAGAGGGVVSAGITIALFDAIEEAAERVKAWVFASEGTNERRDHHVYVLQDPDNEYIIKYVGRTKDPGRRAREHRSDPLHPERKDYIMVVLVSGLTKKQAMLFEQALISAFSLGYLENARREIAVGNVDQYRSYVTAVSEIIAGVSEDALMKLILE